MIDINGDTCYSGITKSDQEVMKLKLNNVPERLKKLRGNMSQKEVADSIGISQSSYAMYETGDRVPNDENKRKLALLFNKSVQEIFFD